MDLGGWLRSLGLEKYEAAFRENEINERVLPSLTQEDLKEIGIGPGGQILPCASRGSGATRARSSERTNCWLRFTGGSRKVLTRAI